MIYSAQVLNSIQVIVTSSEQTVFEKEKHI